MRLRLAIILFSLTVAFGFSYSFPVAWSDEVGVIPEAPEPELPELPQVTLKFSGGGCETNTNESELLRLKGVVGVDIESMPGKMIVTYDPAKLTKQQIKAAVGKKKGGCAASEDSAGGGGK